MSCRSATRSRRRRRWPRSTPCRAGGRVVFAVGSGWLAEEFAALQIPFAERGARTDEYIQICQACWIEDEVHLDGRYYRAAPFRCAPKPVQQPHPPIWIGGNGARALQRAARLGNGWHPIDLGPAEMRAKAEALRQRCAAIGRDPLEMTISLRAPIAVLADVAAYATAGVDYLVLNPRRSGGIDHVLGDVDAVATVSRNHS